MRQCGDCQLCCKLLAVRELDKKAGERCAHQRFKKGCAVYHKPGMPPSCALWNCRWLVNNDMGDVGRPDRSHVVVDIMPDYVTLENEGEQQHVPVVQIWVDPKFPYAYRESAVRAFIERRGKEGMLTLIRWSAYDATTVFPSSLTPDGEWHEIEGKSLGRDHSMKEIVETLGTMKMLTPR